MGKHTKLQKRVVKANAAPSAATPSAPVTIDSMLQGWVVRLERLYSNIEATVESGEATPAILRESAAIARALVSVSAEIRAREKAANLLAEDLSTSDVIRWFRTLHVQERESVVRELTHITSGRSGLA